MSKSELAIAHEKKVEDILRARVKFMQEAALSKEFRVHARAKSAQDIKWFVNYWVTTYNPRIRDGQKIIPFVLFQRQEECLDWIEECYRKGRWGVVVKCRYTGLSWIASAFLVHKLLFEPDFSGSLASNKRDLVDKPGNPDALFEKVLLMIKWLPSWMHEIDLKRHRTSMLIRHPKMNSVIKGESGVSIGRGGRSSIVFADEFAKFDDAPEAIASLSENTDCAIFISTPKGTGNKFYELAMNRHIPDFYYRWTADPRRTPEWREQQDLEKGEEISAQELDCDFNASIKGQYINSQWIKACINAHEKIEGLEPEGGIIAGLDIAATGKDLTILTYREGCVVTSIHELPGQSPTQTAIQVNDKLNEDGVQQLTFDADGIGLDFQGALAACERKPRYTIDEFKGNGRVTEKYWEDYEAHSKDIFYNARAEAWGMLRDRMKKTYNHVNGIQEYPLHELISIPDNGQLLTELAAPLVMYTTTGKIKLESKQDMRKRGIKSPDYADSLAYCFYENFDGSMWGL
ncbi:terminase large subunit domain-containing protein [Myxosarcina sp. GI1(2024)]